MRTEDYISIAEAAIDAGISEQAIRNAIYREMLVQHDVFGKKGLKRTEFYAWRDRRKRGRPKKTEGRP